MLKFLLHTCCAPCSIAIIDELKCQYDLTVFFYNPNIYPEGEYLKRKKYVVRICEEWGVKSVDLDKEGNASSPCEGGDRGGIRSQALMANTTLVPPFAGGRLDYGQVEWEKVIVGFENEPEGGARCQKCFRLRLERTAQFAQQNDFDVFCTTLTSGRNKKAEVINPIGAELGAEYSVKFYEADWKKDDRQEKAKKMVEERGIYRQNYCGCVYSKAHKAHDAYEAHKAL